MTTQKTDAHGVDSAHLDHLSQLDHLRPPIDWKTDFAVLSTYSAHTSVMAAVLLALSGAEDSQGSGSKIEFARAITELKGRVHFVMQSGRLSTAKVVAPIVALLDQFILQVEWDEGLHGGNLGQSWHAKFAIARHVPKLADSKGERERWVFMLGSRNLTLDMSWDIGLVLKTAEEPGHGYKTRPQTVDDIGKIAADLASMFPVALKKLASSAKRLSSAQWRVPEGLEVVDIKLLVPTTPNRSLPKPSSELRRVLAVSPFLDNDAVAEVSVWGGDGVVRQLLSTHMALEKIAAPEKNIFLEFRDLLSLPEPDHNVLLENGHINEDEHDSMDHRGLHAKLLYVERVNGGDTLWMGSPNLTSRAWTRNAECYAQVNIHYPLSSAGKLLRGGLNAFVEMARPVQIVNILNIKNDETPAQRLSKAKNQVSARLKEAHQSSENGSLHCISLTAAPHPDDLEIDLFCAPLIGVFVKWLRMQDRLEMTDQIKSETASDFVRIRLSLGGADSEWLQIICWDKPLDDARDKAALSAYLSSRQMLSWIHEVLSGSANGDEGGAWDSAAETTKTSSRSITASLGFPSIDQALRMWLKDKSPFDEVDRILQIYEKRQKTSNKMLNAEEKKVYAEEKRVDDHLQRFKRSWTVLHKGLRKAVS